jgi:hypothetical protein
VRRSQWPQRETRPGRYARVARVAAERLTDRAGDRHLLYVVIPSFDGVEALRESLPLLHHVRADSIIYDMRAVRQMNF